MIDVVLIQYRLHLTVTHIAQQYEYDQMMGDWRA